MSATWIVGPVIIQSVLVYTVISIVIGILFFRFFSPFTTEVTKVEAGRVSNFLISFVIGIIIGKVLTHLSLLFKNPLAVLAYPADKKVFYIAIIWMVGTMIYEYKKKHYPPLTSLVALLFTGIMAQFVYALIQLITRDFNHSLTVVLTFAGMILAIVFLQKYFIQKRAIFSLLGVWLISNLLFKIFYQLPFFYFYVDTLFWIIVFVLALFSIMIVKQKSSISRQYKRQVKE